MKALAVAARWAFILCLPLLLLSAGIGCAFNSLWLYQYGFQKYDISRVTGIAPAELEKAARGLISYFDSSRDLIDVVIEKDGRDFTLFNEREVIHLKDVKGLVWLDYKVLLATLLYAAGYVGYYLRPRPSFWVDLRRLARTVLLGSGVALGLMLLLGLGSLFDFEGLFIQFHLLSFSNDFWLLDPSRDYLVMLFPGGFWYDATIFIALGTTLAALVLAGASWGHLKFNKRGLPRS